MLLFILGLTALRSDEVIDLMIKEYPAKHAKYSVILQEKERQRITDHYKEYSVSNYHSSEPNLQRECEKRLFSN